jgi:hypothetical protein
MSTVQLTPVPIVFPTTITPAQFNYDVPLTGTVDGVNTTFTTPTQYLHGLGIQIQVFVGGMKVASNAFTPTESGGAGTGYDTIVFTVAPTVGFSVTADFIST